MKLSDHAKHTEELFGLRAEDIHRWIDGFFDTEAFSDLNRTGISINSDFYDHRMFRHCSEALEEAYKEFENRYTHEQIKQVFETHLKDDYQGYIPHRIDFINGKFSDKYHESHNHHNSKTHANKTSMNFYMGILLPTCVAIILFITSIFAFILPVFNFNMVNQKKEMIKQLTLTAVSVMDHYLKLQEAGLLQEDEAKETAVNIIKEMRYGEENKDYFWITDMHPNMVMHPYRTDLNGSDLTNYKDSKNTSGKKLFVEFAKMVKKKNEGYLEYRWQWKDDSSKTVPKLSYVRGVPKWNLIIGTGVYINDIEEEIYELKIELLITFSIISGLLLLILITIVVQGHKIELAKGEAEKKLNDTKDRYRALVETSKEGYLLEINGDIIFSNITLQKLLGYSDKELASSQILKKLFTDLPLNKEVIHHLQELQKNRAKPGQFEAQIYTKNKKVIDVIITTSRTFFSEKNGHIISFRPIVDKKLFISSSANEITDTHKEFSSSITNEISNSENTGHIIEALNKLPLLVRDMLENGTKADLLRKTIGTAYDRAIDQFIIFSINEIGKPPVPFSFLSVGSNARYEMTMFSDQDNALIFSDVDESKLHETRRYFLNLGTRVCTKLDQAGYPFCPGDIMATNPKWCLSLSEWKKNFSSWIHNATPESILEINVFFDIHNAFGNKELFDKLYSHIHEETKKNPLFLQHYARNCLLYRPPLSLFGQIKTKNDVVNLKECLRPIELFARLYALKHDIPATSTLERLMILVEKKVIHDQTYREMAYVFDYLWHLRFKNQVAQQADLLEINNKLKLSVLTDVERSNLKNVLHKITSFQSILSYDFFGTPNG